jgi:glycosyltransferase involved in cell wall biosynthesis
LWADVRALGSLTRILRASRFDVVHTHTPKGGVLGRIAARMSGARGVVNTVHGYYVTPLDPPGKRLPLLVIEWLAARFSDVELFQSREDMAWARRLRIVRRGQGIHLGSGVNLAAFRPDDESGGALVRDELGIDTDALVVTMVGRMVREKGYIEFFRAAELVSREEPRARFIAVGDPIAGARDALTPSEIAGAPGSVLLLGWRRDVADILAATDLFVLASHREGLPRSALEASASALPMVLTDIRGCREVVSDGVEGRLVPASDAQALAETVVELLRAPELRAEMGQRARHRAQAEFDETRVVDLVVQLSQRLTRATL